MEFQNYIGGKWVKGRGDVQEAIDMAYFMGGEGRAACGGSQ